jgi:hypothetical protein
VLAAEVIYFLQEVAAKPVTRSLERDGVSSNRHFALCFV